jgi:uncharacterized protein YggE
MSVPIELAATVRSDRPDSSLAELKVGRKPALPGVLATEIRPSALVGRPTRTIEVVGKGEWCVPPDRAMLNLTVETYALSAQQSAAENAALAQRVAGVLMERLCGEGILRASGCSLFPEYEQPRGHEKPVVTGCRAENSITVDTSAVGLVGVLIDAALGAGASRINYLVFSLDDETQARSAALARATLDAQAQAAALAISLGVRLTRVIRAIGGAQALLHPALDSDAGSIWRGEVTIPATVSIIYQIE